MNMHHPWPGIVLSVVCIFVCLWIIWYAGQLIEAVHEHNEVRLIAVPGCNLPCKCASYYNLGTDEWIECMQVGYK